MALMVNREAGEALDKPPVFVVMTYMWYMLTFDLDKLVPYSHWVGNFWKYFAFYHHVIALSFH